MNDRESENQNKNLVALMKQKILQYETVNLLEHKIKIMRKKSEEIETAKRSNLKSKNKICCFFSKLDRNTKIYEKQVLACVNHIIQNYDELLQHISQLQDTCNTMEKKLKDENFHTDKENHLMLIHHYLHQDFIHIMILQWAKTKMELFLNPQGQFCFQNNTAENEHLKVLTYSPLFRSREHGMY